MSGQSNRPLSLCGSRSLFTAPPIPQRKESLPAAALIPQSRHLQNNSIVPLSTSVPPLTKARITAGPVLYSPKVDKSLAAEPLVMDTTIPLVPVPANMTEVFEAKTLHKDSFRVLHEFYQSGQLCDVELVVGGRTMKCHRVVLACVSRYFRSMFSSEMVESRKPQVAIKDIDEMAMKLLIEFAYTSKIAIDVENVQLLLFAASILQVEPVANACCDFMKTHLHPTNCIGVRNFAEQHGRVELIQKTDQYVLTNFTLVRGNEEFFTIPAEYLENIIDSPDLNVKNEIEVYEAVMTWVKHDLDTRKQHLPGLLSKVRLPLLPPEYLVQTVCKDEVLRTDLTCRDLIDEAKLFHMSIVHVVPDLERSRKLLPRKSCAGVVFCVGGRGSSGDPFKSIECYDVCRDQWFPVTDMSTKRRHVGVVSVDGRLYAIGGHDGSNHLNSGEVFDPCNNKWKPIATMSTLRRGLAVASLKNGPIYALGGLDDATCYNTVERYDAKSDSWSFVKSMNLPRGGVAVAQINDQLYAVGGNDGAASLDSCERYDPHLDRWSMLANMNKRRAGAGCAELGGMLYVVGGFDDNAPLDCVERYDPNKDEWTMVCKMSCPRGGVGVAFLGGKIYAVGGHDGSNYLCSVEAYDPFTDNWSSIGAISSSRAGAGVSFCDTPICDMLGAIRETEKFMASPKVSSCV